MRLRAETIKEFPALLEWCRSLHREGPHQCDVVHRYAIGIYQLHQAVDWAGTPSEDESHAAAIIHILAACEGLDIPVEQGFPYTLLSNVPMGRDNDRLFYNITRLQAQIFYGEKRLRTDYARKSRFDKKRAARIAGDIVIDLFGRILPNRRTEAIYEAMEIMVGVL